MRVARLLGQVTSGQNAGFYLNRSSVTDDAVAEFVKGNASLDGFLASTVADVPQDRALDEVFSQIVTFQPTLRVCGPGQDLRPC